MRRYFSLLLCFALVFGLAACDSLIRTEHLSVTPHIEVVAPSSQEEVANTPPVVSDRTELRGAVLSFIRNWTEQGVILIRNYDGEIAVDLEETVRYATQEDPIGAYAVDFIDAELTGSEEEGSVEMSIVFRRSAAEYDAIVTVSGNSSAYEKILQALAAFDVSLTLRIRNYQEADFARFIYQYCLDNPGITPAIPTLSAQVYPKEGESRILELRFSYPVSKEELRLIQGEVQTIMNSASFYVRSGKDEAESAQLLCRFLTTRFSYSPNEDFPQMPAYELLCQGKAHSFSFASVFYAQCLSAGLECHLVAGSRAGIDHYWNLLNIDGRYYHIDLMRNLELEQTELVLLTTQELLEEGYSWEAGAYPAAVEAPEPDEDETVAPTQDQLPDTTEPTTVPSESTEPPTESVSETESSSESQTESGQPEESSSGDAP